MKKIFLFILIFSSHLLLSQSKKDSVFIPAPVSAKFKSLYPDAVLKKWKTEFILKEEKAYQYYADFSTGEKSGAAIFDTSGNSWQTELYIPYHLLPVAAKDDFEKKHPRYLTPEKHQELQEKYPHRLFYFPCILQGILEETDYKGNKKLFIDIYTRNKNYSLAFDGDGKFLYKKRVRHF